MSTLARRLEKAAYERFDGDRRKAAKYLQDQASFYAHKSESKRGTMHHDKWRAIYVGYSSAAYAVDYWKSLDEEYERDFWYGLDDMTPAE